MDINIDELLSSIGVTVQQEAVHEEQTEQPAETPAVEPVSLTSIEEEMLVDFVQANAEDEEPEPIDEDEDNEEETQETENTPSLETNPPGETEEVESAFLERNPQSLTIDSSVSRFSGAEWFNAVKESSITIAGLGGIGSNLAYQVARLAPKEIILYDGDIVEESNLAGQLYSVDNIGENKASCVYRYIANHCSMFSTSMLVNATNYTYNSPATPIMMCGFDSMKARRMYYTSWKLLMDRIDNKRGLFIDGRLSIDTLQVLCIRGDDEYSKKKYEDEFLFSDDEVEEAVCSLKQTTYMACMIGSVMTNLFVNFIAGLSDPAVPYSLPFFTEYNAQTMIFKTEN